MLVKLAYGLLWIALLAHFVYAKWSQRPAVWIAAGAGLASCGLLGAGLVERGLAAGHWPLTNRYEFALDWAWVMLAIYLLQALDVTLRRETLDAPAGLCALALALLIMTLAVTRSAAEQATAPLLPALRSAWLQVHVLSALVGYGAFSVAAGAALAQVFWNPGPQPDENVVGAAPRERSECLEQPQGVAPTRKGHFRHGEFLWAVKWGLLWLTLSMLSGAIWAQTAWGRYWGWDPKETWALVTWLFYLLILHARSLPAWRGRRLAVLVVAGLGVVMFTFIGVPWLVRTVRLESLHGF